MTRYLFNIVCICVFTLSGCAAVAEKAAVATPANFAADEAMPFTVERITRPGPVAGVLVKVDLTDPRVKVEVALSDDRDPDGEGPCVGLLDTPSNVARRQDFAVTMNASFFEAPTAKEVIGRKIHYYAGNCTYPAGWHFSGGKLVSKPSKEVLRATLVVHTSGAISIAGDIRELPADTRYAVSGNAILLTNGAPVPHARDTMRHPRSAAGVSADGKTLILFALDGRQATVEESVYGRAHSRGATLTELGELMLGFGAANALNLDGGGSTSLVIKDPHTGVFSIANQPSDGSTLKFPVAIERPVADVLGIRVTPRAALPR
jgi:exopolysaccharide biosynthesis protein